MRIQLTMSQNMALGSALAATQALDQKAEAISQQVERLEEQGAELESNRESLQRDFLRELEVELGLSEGALGADVTLLSVKKDKGGLTAALEIEPSKPEGEPDESDEQEPEEDSEAEAA